MLKIKLKSIKPLTIVFLIYPTQFKYELLNYNLKKQRNMPMIDLA